MAPWFLKSLFCIVYFQATIQGWIQIEHYPQSSYTLRESVTLGPLTVEGPPKNIQQPAVVESPPTSQAGGGWSGTALKRKWKADTVCAWRLVSCGCEFMKCVSRTDINFYIRSRMSRNKSEAWPCNLFLCQASVYYAPQRGLRLRPGWCWLGGSH